MAKKENEKEKLGKKKSSKSAPIQNIVITRVAQTKIFSTEEMNKALPVDESYKEVRPEYKEVQAKANQKDSKDYTVIRQETGKIDELNRYKLEYDLLIWKKFYEKCHELDDSFFIQDDNLEKQTRSGSVYEDVTIREIKYRRQNKVYSDKLIADYDKKRYEEYTKKTVGSAHEVDEVIKKNRYEFLVISLLFVALGAIFFVLPIDSLEKVVKIGISSLLIALGLVFGLFFLFKKKEFTIKKYQAKIQPQLSFKEWQNKNCVSEEYINKTNLMKKNYIEALKVKEEKVLNNVSAMIEIKNRMMNIIPLHKDFYTEEGVNNILNVVQARKCDTIRKALKFVKSKEYQVDYLSSTELLVRGLNYVEDSKIYIQEYNNLEYETKKEFDKQIDRNNKILEYLESITFEKDNVISEQFFK